MLGQPSSHPFSLTKNGLSDPLVPHHVNVVTLGILKLDIEFSEYLSQLSVRNDSLSFPDLSGVSSKPPDYLGYFYVRRIGPVFLRRKLVCCDIDHEIVDLVVGYVLPQHQSILVQMA